MLDARKRTIKDELDVVGFMSDFFILHQVSRYWFFAMLILFTSSGLIACLVLLLFCYACKIEPDPFWYTYFRYILENGGKVSFGAILL